MFKFIFFIFSIALVSTQDLSNYFKDIEIGNIDNVKSEISDLLIEYPSNDGVLYLSALLKDRAEEAVISYRALIQNYPKSSYADDALVKIGEYLYARGLYTQASFELRKIPLKHPKSEHIQRSIDLQINSLLAIGENDSAKYYIQKYSNKYTSLDFNYDFSFETPLIARPLSSNFTSKLSEKNNKTLIPIQKIIKQTKKQENIKKNTLKPFVIQLGAFASRQNAFKQSQLINSNGFNSEVWPITVNSKELFAVQITRFETKEDAIYIGEKIKNKINISYLIVNRPLN